MGWTCSAEEYKCREEFNRESERLRELRISRTGYEDNIKIDFKATV
jgi:hypothetical protein